ncbi:enoyl-CoA hydratase/isomerase family protein [Actinocorallia lasiicapitis]
MPTLDLEDSVFVLTFGDDENRFSPDWLKSTSALLDTVAEHPEPAALVTVGGGKFYSNGLDLDWLGQHPDQLVPYVAEIHALFSKVLTLPVPTIAAVNGHAFGGGAMLAMAHDFRIMRADRGYFCFPEADINIPFTPGMAALIQAKLTPAAATASMTTGHRFPAPEAAAHGIVDAVSDLDALLTTAAARVRPLAGKDRATLSKIKSVMYAPAVSALAS